MRRPNRSIESDGLSICRAAKKYKIAILHVSKDLLDQIWPVFIARNILNHVLGASSKSATAVLKLIG